MSIEWDFAVVRWLRYVCTQAFGPRLVVGFRRSYFILPGISVAETSCWSLDVRGSASARALFMQYISETLLSDTSPNMRP